MESTLQILRDLNRQYEETKCQDIAEKIVFLIKNAEPNNILVEDSNEEKIWDTFFKSKVTVNNHQSGLTASFFILILVYFFAPLTAQLKISLSIVLSGLALSIGILAYIKSRNNSIIKDFQLGIQLEAESYRKADGLDLQLNNKRARK